MLSDFEKIDKLAFDISEGRIKGFSEIVIAIKEAKTLLLPKYEHLTISELKYLTKYVEEAKQVFSKI